MATDQNMKPLIIFITGVSGAGLKTGINVLEDNGVHCIDNLPIQMIEPTLALLKDKHPYVGRGIAFGLHIRVKNDVSLFEEMRERLKVSCRLDVIFLTADDNILEMRYSANRRKHHFLNPKSELYDAFDIERELTKPLKRKADMVIDTTQLSPQQFGRVLEHRYQKEGAQRSLYVSLTSFGFKYGQFLPADSIYDVRFLQNPYFVPSLCKKSGLDDDVFNYVLGQADGQETLDRLLSWLRWVLPRYYDEGKHYFRIGIGCTGGRHRSVTLVEALFEGLKDFRSDVVLTKSHRDIKI